MSYEERISKLLRPILASLSVGSNIEQTASFQELMVTFEWYLPGLTSEIHPEFRRSSDGMLAVVAQKTRPLEAQFLGECILIEDQTITPFHVQLEIAADKDDINWLEFRLGQQDGDRMETRPYSVHWSASKFYAAATDINAIDWYYQVGFGDKPEN